MRLSGNRDRGRCAVAAGQIGGRGDDRGPRLARRRPRHRHTRMGELFPFVLPATFRNLSLSNLDSSDSAWYVATCVTHRRDGRGRDGVRIGWQSPQNSDGAAVSSGPTQRTE